MKHKNFLSLICAAGMMLASVPAFPVFAAEESTEKQATDNRDITEDGDLMTSASAGDSTWLDCFNVGNAGTVDYTAGICGSHQFSWKDVKNAQFELISRNQNLALSADKIPGITYNYAAEFDLGETGWYGLSVFSMRSNWFYIVDGWAENSTVRSSAGTKLGTVSADGLEYEVYRCDQQDEELNLRIPVAYPVYWLFSTTNRYDKNSLVKRAVPVGKLMNQLYISGLDAEMTQPDYLAEPQMLVFSGLDAAGKASGSAKFSYCWYGHAPFIESNYKFSKEQRWEAENEYNVGTFDVSYEKDGSFSFSWDDVERAYYLYHTSSSANSPDNNFAVGKTWKYAGEADLGEYGFFGAFFRQNRSENREFFIVEGYGEKCAAWGSDQPLGEISVGSVRYDLYQTDWDSDRGYVYQLIWIVRRDNQYSGANSAFSGEVPVVPIMNQVCAKLLSKTDWNTFIGTDYQWIIDSDRSGTEMVSGKAHFTKLAFEESDNYFTESGRKDGYNWLRCQAAYEYGTSMTTGDKGTFKAEWKDLLPSVSTLFVSGREYNNISLDEVQSISCTYEVKKSDTPNSAPSHWNYGFVSTFADLSGEIPVLTECYFRESGSVSDLFDPKQKFGEFEINDICYRVYILPVNEETKDTLPVAPRQFTKQQCWIERWWDMHNGSITISDTCSVDLLQIFKAVEKLGIKLDGTLTDISFYALADYGTDSLEVLKNEISLVKTGEAAPETNVRGDANGDGTLDVSDAVLASRILVEDTDAKISDQGLLNADIDRSGKLDPADITLMLQVIAKKVKLDA